MKTLLLTIFIVFQFGCKLGASSKINGTTVKALKHRISNLEATIFDFQYQLQDTEYNLLHRAFKNTKENIDASINEAQPACYYNFVNYMTYNLSTVVTDELEKIPCFGKSEDMNFGLDMMRKKKLEQLRGQIAIFEECVETPNQSCDIEGNYKSLVASLTEVESYLHHCEANFSEMDNMLHFCMTRFSDAIKNNIPKILKSFEVCLYVDSYEEMLKRMSLWPISMNAIANYTQAATIPESTDQPSVLSPKGVIVHNKIANRRAILKNALLNYTEGIKNFLAYEKNNAIWNVRDGVMKHKQEQEQHVAANKSQCFEKTVEDLKKNLTDYWRAEVFPECFFPLQDLQKNISRILWQNFTTLDFWLNDTLDCENRRLCMRSLRDILKIEVWFNFWKKVNLTEMKENIHTCLQDAHHDEDKSIRTYADEFRNCESIPFVRKVFHDSARRGANYPPLLTTDNHLDLTGICPTCDSLNYISDPDYDITPVLFGL